MFRRIIFFFSVLGLSSLSAAHNLEGCWEGQGQLTLIHVGKRPCSRLLLKHEFPPSGFVMKALAVECQDFSGSWSEKFFEVRNGKEIWGGVKEKAVIGWLEPDSYWFDEPVNALQYIEYKAERDPQSGRLRWLESFAQNQKQYWKIEADLVPVACDELAR